MANDKRYWRNQMIIFIVLLVLLIMLGCAGHSKKELIQRQYPDCWVTDEGIIMCPSTIKMLYDVKTF